MALADMVASERRLWASSVTRAKLCERCARVWTFERIEVSLNEVHGEHNARPLPASLVP